MYGLGCPKKGYLFGGSWVPVIRIIVFRALYWPALPSLRNYYLLGESGLSSLRNLLPLHNNQPPNTRLIKIADIIPLCTRKNTHTLAVGGGYCEGI